MKFFPINPALDNEINQILSIISLRKNGETHELLQKMGLNYQKNFGASLVHLRQIATTIKKNNELATRLWFREIRETMILATLISIPNDMTNSQLLEWAELVNNAELTEQISLNMFAHVQLNNELTNILQAHKNPYIQAIAYFSLGWAIRKSSEIDQLQLQLTTQLLSSPATDHIIVTRSISHLIRQVIRKSKEGKPIAEKWIENNALTDNKNILTTIEEIKQELIYVSGDFNTST